MKIILLFVLFNHPYFLWKNEAAAALDLFDVEPHFKLFEEKELDIRKDVNKRLDKYKADFLCEWEYECERFCLHLDIF